MSQGRACTCDDPSLVVIMYKHNHSYFSGARNTASEYSEVRCQNCQARWRSKAKFVDTLPVQPCDICVRQRTWDRHSGDYRTATIPDTRTL